MATSWNTMVIEPPQKQLYSYKLEELLELEQYHLNDIVDILDGMCVRLEKNASLKIEMAILDRLYYKIRCVFKVDKQRSSISKIRNCLRRFSRMKLSSYCLRLKSDINEFMSNRTDSAAVYLPSKQMFVHVLIRLQGLAQLLMKTVQYIEEAHYHVLQRIYLGHFTNMTILLLTNFSRLWVLLRSIVCYVVDWYATLKPFALKTKGDEEEEEAGDCELPDDLAIWLGPVFQNFVGREELASSPEFEKSFEGLPTRLFDERSDDEELLDCSDSKEKVVLDKVKPFDGIVDSVLREHTDDDVNLYALSSDEEVDILNTIDSTFDKDLTLKIRKDSSKDEEKVAKTKKTTNKNKKEKEKSKKIVGNVLTSIKTKSQLIAFFKKETLIRSNNILDCVTSKMSDIQFKRMRIVSKRNVKEANCSISDLVNVLKKWIENPTKYRKKSVNPLLQKRGEKK